LKTIDTDDNFFSNYIFNINEDKNGYLWFSSYEGVFAYSRQELNACLDGMSRLPSAIFFNESEGMGSRQCTNIGQPSMAKSPDGNIYVATIQGISVIDPDIIFSSDSLPVSIENLMVDGVSLDLFKPIEISPRFGTLRIDFTATDFTAPEKIHFWYQLEGFDQEIHYMKPGSQRSVSYTGLKPEKYRFILEARQNAATEIVNSCSLDFTIKKPFYRKPIFIAGIILLTVAAGIISQSVMRRNIQEPVKYSTSSLTTEKISSVLPALSDLMENNKEYLNPDLTLVELSKKLHISPNHLSQIINTNFGLNFNDYLNQYRIHEAQRQLSSSELKSKSILEIMFDSGFNSKSVFNTAFKKITGTTPSAYRNKQ